MILFSTSDCKICSVIFRIIWHIQYEMQYNEVQSEKGATKKEQAEKCSPENAGTCNSNTTTASNPRREPFSVRQDNQYGFASTRSQSIDNIKSSIDTIQNDIWEGNQSIHTK